MKKEELRGFRSFGFLFRALRRPHPALGFNDDKGLMGSGRR